MYKITMGDCMEEMKKLEDESVDLILTDPPYGTIKGMEIYSIKGKNIGELESKRNDWDVVVDIPSMLSEFHRVLKPNGRALIFGNNGYTQNLRNASNSNMKYTYPLYWIKNHFASPLSAKKAPVSYVEDITVFSKQLGKNTQQREYMKKVFNYIGKERKVIADVTGLSRSVIDTSWYKMKQFRTPTERTYNKLNEEYNIDEMEGYMTHEQLLLLKEKESPSPVFNLPEGKGHVPNIFEVSKDNYGDNSFHSTQKPVELLKQLIEIYSNEGDVVLDAFMGSGSTGVACIQTDRKFIGIELDEEYFNISKNRIEEEIQYGRENQ